MLRKMIEPLNLYELEDGEIRDKTEKALKAFVEFCEEHGAIMLTLNNIQVIEWLYTFAQEKLEWLERTEA